MARSYLPAVGLGAVAGMRSFAAPALVAHHLKNEPPQSSDWLTNALRSNLLSRVLQAGAAAEMAADKTSWVPDRIAWPSVAWRAVTGGVAGSVVAASAGESRLVGGLLGAAAAVGATYGAYYLRQMLHERLHLSQKMLGAAEDSIAMGAGRRLLAVG